MDKYESEFMGGDAVFREKHISRLFAGLFLIPAVAAAAGAIALAMQGEFAGASAAMFGSIAVASSAVFFAVMRITVSPTELRVQYGMLGPTIALDSITKVEVVILDAMTRLSIGPKLWPDGWRYIPPGARAGVRVTYRHKGRTRRCIIGADDPEALAQAIRTAGATKVRVDATEEEPYEVEESAHETDEREVR